MLKTSLRGQVRQTVLNKYKPLLPLFEAVVNAFQAIQDAATAQGKLVIEIERERALGLDDTPPIIGFNITDSGIGLNDTNFDSFNTAFSELKPNTMRASSSINGASLPIALAGRRAIYSMCHAMAPWALPGGSRAEL
jgi:hypothetical protein